MNLREIYGMLSSITEPSIIDLPSLQLVVSPSDALGAKLVLWLHDQLGPDATLAQAEDVLDAARWWSTFLASVEMAERGRE